MRALAARSTTHLRVAARCKSRDKGRLEPGGGSKQQAARRKRACPLCRRKDVLERTDATGNRLVANRETPERNGARRQRRWAGDDLSVDPIAYTDGAGQLMLPSGLLAPLCRAPFNGSPAARGTCSGDGAAVVQHGSSGFVALQTSVQWENTASTRPRPVPFVRGNHECTMDVAACFEGASCHRALRRLRVHLGDICR